MSEPRLLIGTANFAGQAHAWAQAVTRNTAFRASSITRRSRPWGILGSPGFEFPSDDWLPHHKTVTPWGRRYRAAQRTRFVTHLAIDGFLPLRAKLDAGVESDLEFFGSRGLQCALIAHGSDVRDPDSHLQRFDYSYFRESPSDWVDLLRRTSRRNRLAAERSQVPLFVSTPDLLLDVPTANWLPLTVDVSRWRSTRNPDFRSRPTVLHLPSRKVPPIKGTVHIEPVLLELEAKGLIRYLAPDHVRHSEMPALVGQADIVVDQILTGSYGVAAIEGMAAGRLVIGNVAPEVRDLVGRPLPIADAGPGTLANLIRDLLDDPDGASAMAIAGEQFACQVHDGRIAASILSDFISPG